ncbi:MAG TPA: Gfo/Idh/MocA family oxidoreductase [Thermoanaerobaculaceae bacterium]|nr:Gfo/Idh/MocA family oxidoreductase [Thermoanaerobaculaceae bacterium]HRS15181.1 Gfo/Idh/MocA family oxidoreductase [Thermoanaerobaculaceae bacterium]
MSEHRPIPVSVLGAGHLGRHHVRLARTLPGWACAGAYDPDRSRLQAVCAEHGTTALGSVDEAIEKAEAVVIASSTTTHAALALRCLEAGRHVMVEKPIAATVAEGEAMVVAARRSGAVLCVGHVEFFNPAVQAVLARSPRPRYIETQRLSPFTARSLDIDVVVDLMVHDLQIVQALCSNAPLTEVRAVGVPVLTGKVDLCNVRLELANGCVGNLTASRVSSDRVRKLRLFEPDGYYSVDYAEQTVSAFRLVRGGAQPQIEPVAVDFEKGEPLAAEHLAFQRACRGEPGPLVDGVSGTTALVAAVAVVEAISSRV